MRVVYFYSVVKIINFQFDSISLDFCLVGAVAVKPSRVLTNYGVHAKFHLHLAEFQL